MSVSLIQLENKHTILVIFLVLVGSAFLSTELRPRDVSRT
jgi:hypothetical protein